MDGPPRKAWMRSWIVLSQRGLRQTIVAVRHQALLQGERGALTRVPLKKDLGHRQRVGVGDRQQRPLHAHLLRAASSAAVQPQLRGTARTEDLDVFPEHTARMSCAQRFHGRFLRGESPGKMRNRVSPPRTIGNLSLGKDTTEKPLAIPLVQIGDARNVGGIETQADNLHV